MDDQVLEEVEVPLRSVGASSNAGHPRVAKQNPWNICRHTPAPPCPSRQLPEIETMDRLSPPNSRSLSL